MTFLSPIWLLLLAVVAGIAGLYIAAQFRRRIYAVRFTNLDLLDKIAPERPNWRRHAPALVMLAALVAMVLSLARPAKEMNIAKERATIILALDTSNSMMATDVSPTRLDAAKGAAMQFVRGLPKNLNVGLVEFHGSAVVLVTPTTEHGAVETAIGRLELGPGTAIGEAIFAGLDAIETVPAPKNGEGPAPARIVLMSDGETKQGRPNNVAAAAASASGVPVSTIAFGTPEGVIDTGREVVKVPVNKAALEDIANETGGTFFEASSGEELKAVYADIGSSLGYEVQTRDISRWFSGAAFIALLVAAAMSMLWFSRLP